MIKQNENRFACNAAMQLPTVADAEITPLQYLRLSAPLPVHSSLRRSLLIFAIIGM